MRPLPLLFVLSTSVGLADGLLSTADIKPIAPSQFDKLHQMIRVQPEEQRFWRIAWQISVTEARQLAAKEGKPILVWAGAGGAPIGVC